MDTEDRATVNRRNALQSTGPTTPEGRAVSRMNALRHGLTAESVPPVVVDVNLAGVPDSSAA